MWSGNSAISSGFKKLMDILCFKNITAATAKINHSKVTFAGSLILLIIPIAVRLMATIVALGGLQLNYLPMSVKLKLKNRGMQSYHNGQVREGKLYFHDDRLKWPAMLNIRY
jgi:hypothetical protein